MRFIRLLSVLMCLAIPAFAGKPSSHTKGTPTGKPTGPLKPGEYWWNPKVSPKGPVVVLVSIPQQIVYVYRNGIIVGRSSVSTGTKGHSTPAGVFTILEKKEKHASNLYKNAPMPNMQRLTWTGIAMHSGNLPGYSAAIFRKQLDAIGAQYPNHKKAVLIGHSMGGIVSRLMVTDSGDQLWLKMFGKQPSQTSLAPEAKQLFSDSLIFKHRPDVSRAIFISAPHRGSDLASNWLGRIGSSLVKAPESLLKIGNSAIKLSTFRGDELKLDRVPNSVDTLAPNNRFVKAVNQIPITRGIPYNTISGDRGKGGNKDHTKPVMSDGFVPYWSSHLDGAESELVVRST